MFKPTSNFFSPKPFISVVLSYAVPIISVSSTSNETTVVYELTCGSKDILPFVK